ncbi:hypothetical protein KUV39_08800 [Phaeobacter italicus]|uniref:hypothetical protein n=1 Tax=Phaeobacter italicus TaxID=481446 RepID=UPI001C978FBF|nr:hypothetical protein [Phaeobacter italicus]MBY5976744.1 hypothetical protein [Phaeobacter italicus]
MSGYDPLTESRLKELELMHSKMSGALAELQRVSSYVVVSLAIYYGWFFSEGLKYLENPVALPGLLTIPVVVVFLGWSKSKMERVYIERVATYTQVLEAELWRDTLPNEASEDSVKINPCQKAELPVPNRQQGEFGWASFNNAVLEGTRKLETPDRSKLLTTRIFRGVFWGGLGLGTLSVSGAIAYSVLSGSWGAEGSELTIRIAVPGLK